MSVHAVVMLGVTVHASEPDAISVHTVEVAACAVQASVPAVSSVQLSPNTRPKQLIRAMPLTVATAP